MKRLALLICSIACCWPSSALGQIQALMMDRSLADNDTRYGDTGASGLTRAQISIPQNGTDPCKPVVGLGALSKLIPNASITAGQYFIVTANNSCIEPSVSFLNLWGAYGVTDYPHGAVLPAEATWEGAIKLDGDSVIVHHNQIADFIGWAIRNTAVAAETPLQRRVARIDSNNISRCYSGIWVGAVDSVVTNNSIANVGTYGILYDGGAMQSMGNHVFGTVNSIVVRNGSVVSVNDKASDANTTGYHIEATSPTSTLIGTTTIHCGIRNVWVQADDCRIIGAYIEPANSADEDVGVDHDADAGTPDRIVGLDISGSRTYVGDCYIPLGQYTLNYATTNPRASVGVIIWQHDVVIRNLRLNGSAFGGEQGIFIGPDVLGCDITVTTAGGSADFDDANDAIVQFGTDASPTWTGQYYVVHNTGEIPYRIGTGWGAGLRLFYREKATQTWSEVPTGTAYP